MTIINRLIHQLNESDEPQLNARTSPESEALRTARGRNRSRLNVARLIGQVRRRLDWSQAELAARAHTKQSRISELESLRGNPRFDTLDRVTAALGLEVTLVRRGFINTLIAKEYNPEPRVFDVTALEPSQPFGMSLESFVAAPVVPSDGIWRIAVVSRGALTDSSSSEMGGVA